MWPWLSVNTSPWGSSALPAMPNLPWWWSRWCRGQRHGKVPGVGWAVAVVGVPVDDVVDVQHPIRRAAGHAAAAVAQDHEPAGAFGDGALGASDADRDAAVLVDGVDDGVAADQVTQPGGEAVAEPVDHGVVDVDMDVDPVAVARRPTSAIESKERLAISTNAVGFGGAALSVVGTGRLGLRCRAASNTAPWSASSSPRSSQAPVVEMPQRHRLDRITPHPGIALRRRCRRPGSSSGTGSGAKSNERITRRSCVTVARAANSHNSASAQHGALATIGVDLIQRQRRRRRTPRTSPATPTRRRASATIWRAWAGGEPGLPRQPVRRRDDPRASATHPCRSASATS